MNRFEETGYIGNIDQLWSARRLDYSEGRMKGSGVIEVRTAGGLNVDILPDAGLDIGQVLYKGTNISFITKNGYDGPAAITPHEAEFMNTFPAGLVYTCGLRNAGPAVMDNGEWQPMHGRYHSLQAEHISVEEADGILTVSGTVRESALFGHVLEVRRKIRIPVTGAAIEVEDVLTNLTWRDEEIMHIYHCNIGYPMLSEHAVLHLKEDRKTTPRTEFAKTGLGSECTFTKPVNGEEERVFFHENNGGYAVLENPSVGIRMNMTWSEDTLPIMAQWRSMASGDYALGLEPSNCYIMGRKAERENGSLQVLKGFESIKTKVAFRFETI